MSEVISFSDVVLVMGRELHDDALAAVVTALNQQEMEVLHRHEVPQPVADISCHCVRFDVLGVTSDQLRFALRNVSEEHHVDVVLRSREQMETQYKLAVFDMDSTLITQEVIDELAKEAGAGEEVAEVTARAMRGELEFCDSLRHRVACLKGLEQEAIDRVKSRLQLSEGVAVLCKQLNQQGIKTAILSGGFTYFANHLKELLEIDFVHANQLEIIDGIMTGQVLGDIVDGGRKKHFLEEIAAREGVPLYETIAGGDGANDLPMITTSGLGVAFHAKPLVQEKAPQSITYSGLDALLYLFD